MSEIPFIYLDPPTTKLHTLSLHDALPIWLAGAQARLRSHGGASEGQRRGHGDRAGGVRERRVDLHGRELAPSGRGRAVLVRRSEEHTSELQSLTNLVCRLLLEKKSQ